MRGVRRVHDNIRGLRSPATALRCGAARRGQGCEAQPIVVATLLRVVRLGSFRNARARRSSRARGGLSSFRCRMSAASLDDIIRMKTAADRPQDRQDVIIWRGVMRRIAGQKRATGERDGAYLLVRSSVRKTGTPELASSRPTARGDSPSVSTAVEHSRRPPTRT